VKPGDVLINGKMQPTSPISSSNAYDIKSGGKSAKSLASKKSGGTTSGDNLPHNMHLINHISQQIYSCSSKSRDLIKSSALNSES
jgi:hypothetical protein